MSTPPKFRLVEVLTLSEIRRFIRGSSARGGVVFFALLYALGALFVGGMVVLGNIAGGYSETILWNGGPGSDPWSYPALLIVAPWGVIALPYFATISMVVVSVGVGLGMTVAFLLAIRLLRPKARGVGGSTSVGAVAGLTPAMISLVTLGACCSTTAAATAGVGLVAQATGTSASNLLLNNWYLGVFQMVIIWVALIAQELLLIVYAGLFGRPNDANVVPARYKFDGRLLASLTLRALLLVGGVLWSLSMVAEWTTVNPATAGAGLWFQWIVQHQVLAGLAIAAAFFPNGTYRALRAFRARTGAALPTFLLVAGLTVLWSPPPLSNWGLDGLVNQVLFSAHAPSSWGTISPGPIGGIALVARWAVEYLLLAGFGLSAALTPSRAFTLLGGTGTEPSSTPTLVGLAPIREEGPMVDPSADISAPTVSVSPLTAPSPTSRGR